MQTVDWILIGAYALLLIGVAVVTRRVKSMEDFAIGSRQIPGGIVFATLSASFIGPGYSMGLAGNAGSAGYIWFWIFLAFSLQTLLVGLFVAPRLRAIPNAMTLGDVMGHRYGRLVQLISGLLSVALTAGFVGVIARASGEIIASITGAPFVWAVFASTAFVILYSTFGGIKTVVLTDVLQFIVLAVAIPLVLVMMLQDDQAAAAVSATPDLLHLAEPFAPLALLGIVLGFFLGETLIPPYANRALMARDSGQARKGFVLTAAFSVAWFLVCASIGLYGAEAFAGQEGNPLILAIQQYLPVGLTGIAVAAMISIIMSSQDSLLNAASVSFTNDVVDIVRPGYADGAGALRMSQGLNVAIGVLASVFALNVPGIVDALLYCYTLWAPTVVLPLVIAVLKRDAHPYAALAAILVGGLATGVWEWGPGDSETVPSLLIGVVANQVAFWTAQFLFQGKPVGGWLAPLAPMKAATHA